MKRISFNLTKACLIFATFTESLYKNMGIYFLQNFKKFHLFIEELYARLSLVYVQSIKCVSILT